jgi:hypothetical protein
MLQLTLRAALCILSLPAELDDDAAAADPQRQEKRRRFKEARKQHYNMREQLAR